jgi:peptide/nickel transport system substrate-binding protein
MRLTSESDAQGSPSDSSAAGPPPSPRKRWPRIAALAVVTIAIAAAAAFAIRAPNHEPTISQVSASTEFAEVGEAVTFTAKASDPDQDPLAYTWNFGDNSTATVPIAAHSYSLPGRFVSLLTLTDGRGGEVTSDAQLLFIRVRLPASQVAAPPPPKPGTCPADCALGPGTAILVANQTAVAVGSSVRFSGNASWAYTWAWNNVSNRSAGGTTLTVSAADSPSLFTTFTYGWGDGSLSRGGNALTVGATSHRFMSPGNFLVRLTLTLPTAGGVETLSAGYTVRVTATPPPFTMKHPDVFTTASFGEPDSLDPAADVENSGIEVLQNVYETLVWYQPGVESPTVLVPRLATDLPTAANGGISADGRNYTFAIRPNVRFHSGAALTSDDVVYSIQRVLSMHDANGPSWILEQVLTNYVTKFLGRCGPLASCSLADYADTAFPSRAAIPPNIRTVLEGAAGGASWSSKSMNRSVAWAVSNSTVQRLGTGQVQIHLTRPYPAFLQALAFSVGSVVEKACASPGDRWGLRNDLLDRRGDCGTGPYKLKSWVPNQELVLQRFDGYWGTAATLGEVRIEKVNDVLAREFLLFSGDADAAVINRDHQDDVMGPTGAPRSPSLRIVKDRPTFDITVFGYNQAINTSAVPDRLEVPTTFFSNLHVRRTFSLAFDYQGFLDNVTYKSGIQLRGPIAKGLLGYNMSTPLYAYNLSRAAAELRQTPYWTPGFNITLYYNAGNTERQQGCLLLQGGLQALEGQGAGPITVRVRTLDWPVYLSAFRARGLPIFFLGWRADYADPDDYMIPFLRSGGLFASSVGYSNRTLDGLIDAAAAELNQTRRDRMYQDLTSRVVVNDVPYLWVYQGRSFHVERAWVRGYYFNAMLGGLDFYRLSKVAG